MYIESLIRIAYILAFGVPSGVLGLLKTKEGGGMISGAKQEDWMQGTRIISRKLVETCTNRLTRAAHSTQLPESSFILCFGHSSDWLELYTRATNSSQAPTHQITNLTADSTNTLEPPTRVTTLTYQANHSSHTLDHQIESSTNRLNQPIRTMTRPTHSITWSSHQPTDSTDWLDQHTRAKGSSWTKPT